MSATSTAITATTSSPNSTIPTHIPSIIPSIEAFIILHPPPIRMPQGQRPPGATGSRAARSGGPVLAM